MIINPDKTIIPDLKREISKADKELLLNQRAICFWLTGLSGSGKTAIAVQLEKKLHKSGYLVQIIDGDIVRYGINKNLGFSLEDRKENIRRISEVNKLFLECGVITINCFVSPTNEIRSIAKQIIGKEQFKEIFIDTPIEECERRDPKGLYKLAKENKIGEFTGISSPFDIPENPDKIIQTQCSIEESTEELLQFILPIIQLKK